MPPPTKADLVTWFGQLRIHQAQGVFAPHKPLLLLSALAAVQRGDERLTAYAELEPGLHQLLVDFGPPRGRVHPEYPFWRLQGDQGGFWQVPERELALAAITDRPRQGDIPPRVLVEVGARGGFTREVHQLLRDDSQLVNVLSRALLDNHFARSSHESLLDAVGMPWIADGRGGVQRSPKFRDDLIRLYESRCAVCEFDGKLGVASLALEAAHIRWHAYGGPDDGTNGLLLCSLHHTVLDRGAIGISDDHTIMVSQHVHGGSRVKEFLSGFAGRALRPPQDPLMRPAAQYIAWHRENVFRDPPKVAVAREVEPGSDSSTQT